ncbi:MAG: DUF839 domain-containing protein, partial [Holophagales bacterium]|nr:DUF839 domain-containing protein [Holophagales bacterium]
MTEIPKPSPDAAAAPAVLLDRRSFLRYVGAGAGAIFGAGTLASALGQLGCAGTDKSGVLPRPDVADWVLGDGRGNWAPPPYPVPLPGDGAPPSEDATRLARYEVIDDLVLPPGYRYHVVAQWGDVFGPRSETNAQILFGYDNDYTGLVPIPATEEEYWLFVNHEYIAVRPWIEGYEEVYGEKPPELELREDPATIPTFPRGLFSVDGWQLPRGHQINLANEEERASIPPRVAASMRQLAYRFLGDLGVSVLRVRRLGDGRMEVIEDAPDHRRITSYSRVNIPGAPEEHSRFTGPAAVHFETPPRGTMSNCSGGTTPWGTFLSCEENFHYDTGEDISPEGKPFATDRHMWGARGARVNGFYVFDNPTPPSLSGTGFLLDEPLDGREFGWVVEVDPATGHMAKHTALGRFRHENVALRVEAGKPLAAYMGDDRRGGHVWKFVSEEAVKDPKDPANSRLFEKGTLYVARFEPDFTGRWIPLRTDTPLRRPEPEHGFSQHMKVPSRFKGGAVGVGDTERDNPELEVDDWISVIERFTAKPFAECTLGDLVRAEGSDDEEIRQKKNGVIAMDAFLMANASGGTPTARPEDLEVHPVDRTVYIAFTDATDSSDGSPDSRIFPDSSMESSRQYGAIYRILEGGSESPDSDPAADTFTWGKFVASGEVAEDGGGFACADNMVFDPRGHLWMVTDITTSAQNFPTTRKLVDGTFPGGKYFPGVFGNNSMFLIPTEGALAGMPQLFA